MKFRYIASYGLPRVIEENFNAEDREIYFDTLPEALAYAQNDYNPFDEEEPFSFEIVKVDEEESDYLKVAEISPIVIADSIRYNLTDGNRLEIDLGPTRYRLVEIDPITGEDK